MDAPFDHTNFGLRERPASKDHNQLQSQIYRALRETMRALTSPRQANGTPASQSRAAFFGDGLNVVPNSPTGMSVIVTPGYGFLYDAVDVPTNIGATDLEEVDDLSPYKPSFLLSPVTFTVPAAPGAGQGRTDIIEVKIDRRLENAVTRKQLDPGTVSFLDHVFNKTLAFGLDGRTGVVSAGGGNSTAGLSYKIGTAAAVSPTGFTPVAGRDGLTVVAGPATSPGYVKIADIHVNTGTTAVVQTMIADQRSIAGLGGAIPFSGEWRIQYNAGDPITTARSICAPPGVYVGLVPWIGGSTARATGTIIVAGGDIRKIAATLGIRTAGPAGTAGVCLQDTGSMSTAYPLSATDSDFEFEQDGHPTVPYVPFAWVSKFASYKFNARFFSNGGTVNSTDAILEDVVVSISGTILY